MITQSLPSLNIFQSCINCFIGYCEFSGRGRRSEFWWFSLIYSMISGIFNSILTQYMNFDYFYYTDKSSKVELENFQAFLFFVGIFLFGEILIGIPFHGFNFKKNSYIPSNVVIGPQFWLILSGINNKEINYYSYE